MKVEYGDYLALACNRHKGEDMARMKWKIDKLNWQEMAIKMRKEEEVQKEERKRQLTESTPTPFIDDVCEAARILGCNSRFIRFHILEYAERNNFCHSGIEDMIDQGSFAELVETIYEDKKNLAMLFQGRPEKCSRMLETISLVEKEWFVTIHCNARDRTVGIPTEKLEKKNLQLFRNRAVDTYLLVVILVLVLLTFPLLMFYFFLFLGRR